MELGRRSGSVLFQRTHPGQTWHSDFLDRREGRAGSDAMTCEILSRAAPRWLLVIRFELWR